jgi:hypothetical protein
MALIFAILVLAGFGFWWMATWPVTYAERIARGFFFAAAILWFLTKAGISL